jgi:uncharacterized protein YyaL (SSP411 family)
LTNFVDKESGAFFTTAKDHESLILRRREGSDGATPSGNAVASLALARLSFHFDREDLRSAAQRAITAYGKQISVYPHAFAKSLAVVDLLLEGPVELALIGTPGEATFEALRREIGRHYLPNRIIAHCDRQRSPHPPSHSSRVNWSLDRQLLYVCRSRLPGTDQRSPCRFRLAAPHRSVAQQAVFGRDLPARQRDAGRHCRLPLALRPPWVRPAWLDGPRHQQGRLRRLQGGR